jgi:diguanylate cyclase (GGDEF)-like protein
MPALVLLANVTLLLRGDVHVATVLALDAILLALGIVTAQLSERALGARRDPLTGLPNRRSTDDRLQELVAGGGTFSVALLDLDHFKEVNDTAGHEAGDRVLLRVAAVPERVLPPGAVLARQGGDEFVLLLPGRGGEQAVADVWRVCDALAGIGLSCGVAQHEPGDSVAQLMRRADGALYAAKSAGRGRVELAATTGAPA